MGRKTKLNKEMVNDAHRAAQLGMSMNLLCDYIGVPRRTVYDWLRRGSEEPGSIFADFSHAISRGRSQCAAMNLHRIQQASQDDWRASAWIMERRFGYHRQLDVRTEYAAADSSPIQTGQELEQLLDTLNAADVIRGHLAGSVIHEDEDEDEADE